MIGSGPNGLLCAIRLAAAGLEVTVLEQAAHAGGGVSSSEATIPGFVHDLCAGFFPLTAASPAFARLGLERHGLEWINPPVPMAHPFGDGTAIALHRDVGATAASLERAATGAGRAWEGFVAPLLEQGQLVARTALRTFPPVVPGLMLALKLRRQSFEIARLMLGSVSNLGRELFDHPAPTAWLCGSAAHSDLAPGDAGGAAFGFALNWLGHFVGWPIPRGGAGRLPEAMVARLAEAGGGVRCGAPVERILSRAGRVSGVRLAGGEDVAGDVVVATISAGRLGQLLPDDALPERLLRRLRRWRYGLGTFKVDWALSGPVPWTAREPREAAVVHVGDTVEAYFRSAQASELDAMPRAPAMVVGQQSLHDRSRAPEGGHTLYAYARVASSPDVDEERMAERMEARIETFAPGFRGLILGRSQRSPARLERDNPSFVGGDLGGGSFELDQQLVFRPAPELVRHRTPLRGLYVGSSSVHPGAGVHGVPGAGAAAAVIADRSRLRLWR